MQTWAITIKTNQDMSLESYVRVGIYGDGIYTIQYHRHGAQLECLHNAMLWDTWKGEVHVLQEQ